MNRYGCVECALGLLMSASMWAQTGSIQGVVVGADGTKIPNARVFVGIPSSDAAVKAPPTVMSKLVTRVDAGADGSFTIKSVPAGSYVLCAQTVIPGWLDPCHWAAAVPTVTVAAGQIVTGQKITMNKGAILNVHINDQTGQMLQSSSRVPSPDVTVMIKASNNRYYGLAVTGTSKAGRDASITVPFDVPHTLLVSSNQFSLADEKNSAVAASGYTQTIQIPSGTASKQITVNATGRSAVQ